MFKKILAFFYYPTPYIVDLEKKISNFLEKRPLYKSLFFIGAIISFLLFFGFIFSIFIGKENEGDAVINSIGIFINYLNLYITSIVSISVIELLIRKKTKVIFLLKEKGIKYIIHKIFLFIILFLLLYFYGFILLFIYMIIPEGIVKEKIKTVILNPKESDLI